MFSSREDFDGEVRFIGLARRNVQWTFRRANARRADAEKTAKPDCGKPMKHMDKPQSFQLGPLRPGHRRARRSLSPGLTWGVPFTASPHAPGRDKKLPALKRFHLKKTLSRLRTH